MKEVVIVDAVRSPIGNVGGSLASIRPDDLLADILKGLVNRTGIDPALITDVYAGCGNQAGEDNRNVARMAALLAGFPVTVPGVTVNRNCSSGLEAINQAANPCAGDQHENNRYHRRTRPVRLRPQMDPCPRAHRRRPPRHRGSHVLPQGNRSRGHGCRPQAIYNWQRSL